MATELTKEQFDLIADLIRSKEPPRTAAQLGVGKWRKQSEGDYRHGLIRAVGEQYAGAVSAGA